MPLNLKNPNAISGGDALTQLSSLVKDWGPTLNRWALKTENRLDQAHQAANAAPAIVQRAISQIPVTPPSTITDGLVHGTLPWVYDPAYTSLRDDFISGNSSTSPIGELGWQFAQVTAGTFDYAGDGAPNLGVVQIFPTGTGANNGGEIFLSTSTTALNSNWFNSFLPLLDYPGWKMTWVFCLRRPLNANPASTAAFNITKSSVYIGLGAGFPNTFSTRPPVFIGCRYDTDTTAPSINDSTFWLEATLNGIPSTTSTRFNNQGTLGGAVNTGITPVEREWHRLDISCVESGKVSVTLDNAGQTFSVSQQISTLNTSLNIVVGNGAVNFGGNITSPTNTNGLPALAPGSLATVAGLTAGLAVNNGTYSVWAQGSNNTTWYAKAQPSAAGGGPTGYTVTAYPALTPVALYLNDSSGSAPASGTRSIAVDFFSLVWNKGLSNPSYVPISTNPRY